MTLPTIMTPDGRRAWAFLALVGGAIVFTGFAAVGVYLVRDVTAYSLYLALAAHGQVFVVLGALGWVLGRRMLARGGKDGIEVDDRGDSDV